LSIDLASACVSYVKETYGHPGNNKFYKLKVIESLRLKVMALNNLPDAIKYKVEMTLVINQLLDTVTQTKKDLSMSRWIHMPQDSEEYQYYKYLRGNYEAYGYSKLGALTSDASEEGFNIMMTHYKKASVICKLVGMKDKANNLDTLISVLTTEKQAANDGDASSSTEMNSALEVMRNVYKDKLHTHGMDSEDTIRSGLLYAKRLWGANNCIEAERLVTKLATVSRRVHGPDHKITIDAVELLEQFRERFVKVFQVCKDFQALRYENDGEICVIQGPITEPRNTSDERVHRIKSYLIIPGIGCPVICHGLVSASHLNGELGEVRNIKQDGTEIRLGVNFEKKGLESALVKPENLRIVFELPELVNG
jgi:hypothetical protein